MKSLYLLLIFISLSVAAYTQEIKVPSSKQSVLLDGKFEKTEWQDAKVLVVDDSLTLYFKQDSENLYWCLHNGRNVRGLMGVDFYFTVNDSLIDLHASAKLGERQYSGGGYGEWRWWNNRAWAANVSRFNSFEGQRFLPDEAKEFQLRKSRFANKPIRLMFQLDQPGFKPAFPPNATVDNPQKWLRLVLD